MRKEISSAEPVNKYFIEKQIDPYTLAALGRVYNAGMRVDAIRLLRDLTGCKLSEAKEIMEDF